MERSGSKIMLRRGPGSSSRFLSERAGTESGQLANRD
jgi:hypothetical protein